MGDQAFSGMDKLFGGEKEKPAAEGYGALVVACFSDSGNSLGNLYSAEAMRDDNLSTIVVISEAEMHSVPITKRTYRADDDLLGRIDAIVDAVGAKTWGELPPSEFIALDASTPLVRLQYQNRDGSARPLFLNISSADQLPEGGRDAIWQIRDLIESFATEGNFIGEEQVEVRN